MVKKFLLLFLTLLISLSLVGCTGGSYIITIGGIDSSQNELSGEYNSFSGYFYKKVTVEDGDTLTITLLAETDKGELFSKVIDSEGKTIEILSPGDSVNLNESGKYKFQVEGKKHKGSFVLSWQ